MNYYNEINPNAIKWLRQLIDADEIPYGIVDDRSISDVTIDDIKGFTQCHFFAGIGGWSLALKLAGWSINRPVWTGSCPCQPFSSAGNGNGENDERHLWPQMRRLIEVAKPAIIFGEQVASKAGQTWFAGVRSDCEKLDYAVGGADICGASVGTPHIRQRMYWVAVSGMLEYDKNKTKYSGVPEYSMGEATSANTIQTSSMGAKFRQPIGNGSMVGTPWADCIRVKCEDGRYRRFPAKPGFLGLVDGLSDDLGGLCFDRYPIVVGKKSDNALLHGFGNAIVPQLAATFISCFV